MKFYVYVRGYTSSGDKLEETVYVDARSKKEAKEKATARLKQTHSLDHSFVNVAHTVKYLKRKLKA